MRNKVDIDKYTTKPIKFPKPNNACHLGNECQHKLSRISIFRFVIYLQVQQRDLRLGVRRDAGYEWMFSASGSKVADPAVPDEGVMVRMSGVLGGIVSVESPVMEISLVEGHRSSAPINQFRVHTLHADVAAGEADVVVQLVGHESWSQHHLRRHKNLSFHQVFC